MSLLTLLNPSWSAAAGAGTAPAPGLHRDQIHVTTPEEALRRRKAKEEAERKAKERKAEIDAAIAKAHQELVAALEAMLRGDDDEFFHWF